VGPVAAILEYACHSFALGLFFGASRPCRLDWATSKVLFQNFSPEGLLTFCIKRIQGWHM